MKKVLVELRKVNGSHYTKTSFPTIGAGLQGGFK